MTLINGANNNIQTVPTVTTVTINSVTATTISPSNPDRRILEVYLAPGINDADAIIRPYAASVDNVKHGAVLTRRTASNDALFKSEYKMSELTIITAEYSAISVTGTFDLYIIEG